MTDPGGPAFESRAADWLSYDAALERVLAAARPTEEIEVPLAEAPGRALARDLHARASLPPWDNSAMDGYAVRKEDVLGATASEPVRLRVVGQALAGARDPGRVEAGRAVRIMTGAPVPAGADSVVRVEHTDGEAEPGWVRIHDDGDAGGNVRPGGQDMREGDRVLPAGATIHPGTVGVLAALGLDRVPTRRAPVVAVLATGDELLGPDAYDEVRAGRGIPESNGPMLAAAVEAAGGVARLLPTAPDDPDALRRLLVEAAAADAVVTIGGASMGEADLVKRVLDEIGYRPDFWRARIRPGSPVSLGYLSREGRDVPVFGLPGNPASAFVTFEVFVRPFLRRSTGHAQLRRRRVRCRASEPLSAPAELTYFLRVRLDDDLRARLAGPQSSGLVRTLGAVDGLAVVPPDVARVEPDEEVDVMLLDGSGWPDGFRPGAP